MRLYAWKTDIRGHKQFFLSSEGGGTKIMAKCIDSFATAVRLKHSGDEIEFDTTRVHIPGRGEKLQCLSEAEQQQVRKKLEVVAA